MKRKKTPVADWIVQRLMEIEPELTEATTRAVIASFLTTNVNYAGDMKQLAEKYGCHYLRSKRMRTRELQQFVIDNHPAVKTFETDREIKDRLLKKELGEVEVRAPESWEEVGKSFGSIVEGRRRVMGIDWGVEPDRQVTTVYEMNEDGSLSPVNAEVTDDGQAGTGGSSKAD